MNCEICNDYLLEANIVTFTDCDEYGTHAESHNLCSDHYYEIKDKLEEMINGDGN